MALGEFGLIEKFFTRSGLPPPAVDAHQVVLGVGDDCALLAPGPGRHLAVSTDMLVEGRHFLSTVAPERLGHKSLAVNLSDLAACGADPVAFTLALAMPRVDEVFLAGFSHGLFALADEHQIALVGGDTTAGPLSICITVMGELPAGQALRRDGARPGDTLWVSHPIGGGLGDARLALEVFRGQVAVDGQVFERIRRAMEMPQPRVRLGRALRGLATAAIDLSDGLVGDLAHVLRRSTVGAVVNTDALPRSADLAAMPEPMQRLCLLTGGDDYELLFTAPPDVAKAVRSAAAASQLAVTPIGRIEATPGLQLQDGQGRAIAPAGQAFDHFA